MKELKISIGGKIFIGFLILIFIYFISAAISYITLRKNNKTIYNNSEQVNPSKDAVNDLNLLVTKSRMYTINWVYQQKNEEDKNALKAIHTTEYPQLKATITTLSNKWKPADKKEMEDIFTKIDTLMSIESKKIMNVLLTFDSYQDAETKFNTEGAIESEIVPQSNSIIKRLEKVSDIKKSEALKAEKELVNSSNGLITTNIILFLVSAVAGILISFFTARSITNPINYLKSVVLKLSSGELPEKLNTIKSKDEVGEMSTAVDQLVQGLQATSNFAQSIGNGNYEAEFTPLSDHDILGNSLIEMRDNLQRVSKEDKTRVWATEGLAKFGDILRSHTDSITQLCDTLITELIKYTNSNQGAVFIVEETENEEAYMTMAACYAWDRKKYLDQRIEIGEGLIGQSWQEKDTIYITDVPEDYITITSGLGEASPTNILIVPLIFNEKVQGVIEIAGFNIYENHEVEFVQKISENIASTISTVKTNETTKHLLQQSQELTEEMRAQEEEMRQNMEELEATQEEMRRNEQQYIDEIKQLKERV